MIPRPWWCQIEITNVCQGKCPMCPRTHRFDRELGYIEDETVDRIFEQLPDSIDRVFFHHFGESLLHDKVFDYINKAVELGYDTTLSTNGIGINKEVINKVLDSKLGWFNVSMDGFTENTRKFYRGKGDYKEVSRNIRRLKRRKGTDSPIIVMSMLDIPEISREEKEDFAKFWNLYAEEVRLKGAHAWRGDIDELWKYSSNEKGDEYPYKCAWAFYNIVFLWNGDIVPCCRDYNGDYIIGNIKEQDFDEIWYSKKNLELMKMHLEDRREEIDLCKYCDAFPQLHDKPPEINEENVLKEIKRKLNE